MINKKLRKHACYVGVVAVLLYVACLFWQVLLTDPSALQFHMLALKVAFPGFQGFDNVSLFWGGVLSFVYGSVASLIFHSIHNDCCMPKK